ncbi:MULTISPECIES: hypothetical protein [Flavobacterium]|uniref:DUF642 domain-containing protein n=1 Tax=Flavobacterium lipolyticum TaxID=2893754 RepID=A0ABS8M336_9FLAO|nr:MULTISPECIES: hypothetical protein [unclassified Flavobacterium]MCC9019220.1 hypothetical protein [Flavobacterium sp. F-126]
MLVFFAACNLGYAQTIKVLDNKGTLRNIEQGIGNLAELYIGSPATPQTLAGTFSDISFASSGIVDTSDFSVDGSSITISKSGRYEITYRISTTTTNNEISGGEFYLEVGGTEAPGTRAYTYTRNSLVDKNSVAVTKIIVTTAATVIKIKGRTYASTAAVLSLSMTNNGSSLIVKRIK